MASPSVVTVSALFGMTVLHCGLGVGCGVHRVMMTVLMWGNFSAWADYDGLYVAPVETSEAGAEGGDGA